MLTLGLAFALVVATAALAASCLRLRSAVGFLLAVYVLATAEIVAVSLALSTVRGLTRPAVLAVVVVVFVVVLAAWWWLRASPAPSRAPGARSARRARRQGRRGARGARGRRASLPARRRPRAAAEPAGHVALPPSAGRALEAAARRRVRARRSGRPDQRLPSGRRDRVDGVDGPERRRPVRRSRPAPRSRGRVWRDRRHRAAPRPEPQRGAVRALGVRDVHRRRAPGADRPQRPGRRVAARRLRVLRARVVTRRARPVRDRPRARGRQRRGRSSLRLPVLAVFVLASQPRSRWWPLAAAGASGTRRRFVLVRAQRRRDR